MLLLIVWVVMFRTFIYLHFVGALQKCIWCVAKMHFCVHFPKENVQRTFSKGKCSAYIFQRKMFSVHFPKENVQQNKMLQMHLMLCKNAFVTFCVTKCTHQMHFGVHFPKENVQHHIWLCKMFSITFYKAKCSAKSKKTKHSKKQRECVHFTMSNVTNAFDALQNYIFASHFVLRCKNAFVTFCYTKCTHQMHLMLPLHFVGAVQNAFDEHFV